MANDIEIKVIRLDTNTMDVPLQVSADIDIKNNNDYPIKVLSAISVLKIEQTYMGEACTTFSRIIKKGLTEIVTVKIKTGKRMADAEFRRFLNNYNNNPPFSLNARVTVELPDAQQVELNVSAAGNVPISPSGVYTRNI